jgi:hypothetical protein
MWIQLIPIELVNMDEILCKMPNPLPNPTNMFKIVDLEKKL